MLEDQVAYFLQRYLGNYVRGLSREALKISVWQGNVELTNMQLKPEALNALKLPVKVKAGFLGSVKIKVPWSRLGQDPVLVSLDQIFLLAEPATHVEGCSEDAVQEAKRSRVREMETRLLEKVQQMNSEMNKSWLGSFIDTIIGNLKLSISNIHIRYEDLESNPGHPFAAGLTLEKLSAITVDDNGREIFATGGALERIQKSVELEQLSVYLDSDISPWYIGKLWDELLPSEWGQIFKFGTKDGKPAVNILNEHSYILQPVTGNAKYSKLRSSSSIANQPVQKAAVNLDDVTLCLSKDGYGNILKLADNFAAFNQRLKYAHYRPRGSVKSNPRSWWKYAYKAISDQMKKESGKLSWEQVLRYASLRKRYISLYASLLKSDPSRTFIDDNKDIGEIDRELDIDLILQWRMLAHKFVDQSLESEVNLRKQKAKKSWWSVGWGNQSYKDDNEPLQFSEEDWERLNKIIGYKEDDNEMTIITDDKGDVLHTSLDIHMRHNASKLVGGLHDCLAELSCESLDCSIQLYSEAKVFDVKLGSYKLSSPSGLLAESATVRDSLVGVFCYKPFDAKVDWSLVAKASPCYMTYLKDSVDQIVNFFGSQPAVSQTVALEAAAAVQMTIDGVKRTAQEQVNKALKDHARFLLDLDIAAPKISIPTDFRPDHVHTTKLMLDLGNLVIRTQDEGSNEEMNLYLQFDLVLSDVSAFLVDGDFHWSQTHAVWSKSSGERGVSLLPVIDKCGVIVKLQQIRLENPSFPSTRLSMRLPSLGFHFSPARYHRLMQIAKIFQDSDTGEADTNHPWNQADFEGWLSFLSRKGVGNREAIWKKRYICLVGPFVYMLESPSSKSYKQYISLRGKQIYQVPADLVGGMENVFAISDASRSNSKVVEDASALILRCDTDESRKIWQSRLQGAIYRASGSVPINNLAEDSSDSDDSEAKHVNARGAVDASETEKVFITGVLDEFKICFNYNHQSDQKAVNILLEDEKHLFEFRAVGGQVELLIKGKDMFIGTVLKSLEIDDLVSCSKASHPCYLARSFIGSENAPSFSNDPGIQSQDSNDLSQNEGDEFYEAEENLIESVDYPSAISSLKPPSFTRATNLLPDGTGRKEGVELSDALDSFVKAQIVICDQNSPSYNKMDTQVIVTLATLSFFCRRPTILAIMEFVNALNTDDEKRESLSDNSSLTILKEELTGEDIDGQCSAGVEEPVLKSFLGKGKSRIIFNLSLHMARAQIALMNENETKLATLSQDNLLTDIKVYPSSFSIKASLGNLRISDDSLSENHIYFWACDMRNPGGSSFVELIFSSYNMDDEDYKGYEYSLLGQLSEVRIVYLNRFVQEVVSYFMGLIPNDSKGVVKLKDQVTNSEKWFTTGEIEGSPAVKLDVSLRKPIIVMPQRTDSLNYLKLDIVHITIQNTFQWFGSKSEMNAVHVDIMTVMVEDINLNVGTGSELGQSIIEDVTGVSIVVQRSLRDLLHQIPSIEVAVNIEQLKAALSNREYQIITDCTLSNIAETPHVIPPLDLGFSAHSVDAIEPACPQDFLGETETQNEETWTDMKVSVNVNLVQLGLHSGKERDASLAILQISHAWLLYKSNSLKDGFLSATLKSLTVIDDREGTEEEFRLAVGNSENWLASDDYQNMEISEKKEKMPIPTLLILDAKFSKLLTSISICIQRPQLLVALDFLLAVVEFFVPSIGGTLPNHDDESSLHVIDAIILDKEAYTQPSAEIALSPQKPLVADDDRFDLFIYDGGGGTLYLQDRQGSDLTAPSEEAIIFVGTGKRLEFRNVVIKNGHFLDSCILLGTDSSYSVLRDDNVLLDEGHTGHLKQSTESALNVRSSSAAVDWATELIVELQAIAPELTFYNTSREIGESAMLSNKLLHAQLDAFCRLVLKGDTVEMSGNALGLTMESNGVRIIEPFDTSLKFSNASGKTNIHVDVSNIFMNFSFSILRLFLAVEEDILAFLRRTSKKLTIVCSQFDKVGTIQNLRTEQIYAFWRPHAPPGFSALGDYLTPLDKPPSKGVVVVNTSLVRVKKPVSFKLIWSAADASGSHGAHTEGYSGCSIWLPEAPKGYVSLGCVVSQGRAQPPLTSVFCISASLVSPCALRDCIAISFSDVNLSTLAFWRVDNSMGTFLPADVTLNLAAKAYELRRIFFGFSEATTNVSETSKVKSQQSGPVETLHPDGSTAVCIGRYFEAVASFQLIWWNEGSSSRKKLSIWRPVVPEGMAYFGDIAIQGYEPPNTCFVLRDTGNDEILRAPIDFQLVGQIKKQKRMESISLWNPQAPPGFVSLGCIACKGTPKQYDLSGLRCIRSDMVTGVHFDEESVWDTSDAKSVTGPFSVWAVGNALGTFIVRSGLKKPPKRFALKIVDPNMPSCTDDTVIDAEIGTFSAAVFDDYGGLMVPLFNVSLSSVGFSLHGRQDNLNSAVSFSLSARSYNDKYEAWEPLVEPMDGFLRYQYNLNAPDAASQLRITATRDLNLNISVSNANMIIQAYASWNNLSRVHNPYREREALSPIHSGRSIIDIHPKKNYYIIPQNRLGQDIFIRATEIRGLRSIVKMPSGDMKPVKVPVSKDMLDSHLRGNLRQSLRTMVTVIIKDAQFLRVEGLASHQYTVAVRLNPDTSVYGEPSHNQQSARTCGSMSDGSDAELISVNWSEVFFFKVDSVEHYVLEMIVTDIGKGAPVGFFSAPLRQIARKIEDSLASDYLKELAWIELCSKESESTSQDRLKNQNAKIRCAVILSPQNEVEEGRQSLAGETKSGFLQISPSKEGPWTTVRLNYAAPAACWRLGNNIVASEVIVNDGNRYVNIRSLVSIRNTTIFTIDVCLKPKSAVEVVDDRASRSGEEASRYVTDEYFETESNNPDVGSWSGSLVQSKEGDDTEDARRQQLSAQVELPTGWEWVDDWHLDASSVSTPEGWVYAPNVENLKWPESSNPLKSLNYARQRRWIRNRKLAPSVVNQWISVGILKPGDTLPLPLPGLAHSGFHVLKLRPSNSDHPDEYSWSSVVDKPGQPKNSGDTTQDSEICVSSLTETDELLFCSKTSGTSSNCSRGLWFSINVQAIEIAKDIHSEPIQDWCLVVKSPLSITNFLPFAAEFAILEEQTGGHFIECSRGIFAAGESVKVYSADMRKQLYLSLLPQRGWLPIHEAVLISDPNRAPSKSVSLRSSVSGRMVQILIEENNNKERPASEKIIRVYAPYWLSVARCPPLTYRLIEMSGKKQRRKIPLSFQSKNNTGTAFEEITDEEIYEGYTIASALNFKLLGLAVAVAVTDSGTEQFTDIRDLSPLGDMDGSLDINAFDADGHRMRLFISSKPCPYQSVPTKVISVRPYMTFTNRAGENIFVKMSAEDDPKILHASDSRVSFLYCQTSGSDKLQVKLGDTKWSFPIEIVKEDTIYLVLRKDDGKRRFLRTEIRGYEEGSRFIVVFRLGSTKGPIRFENRTIGKTISIRQSGFGDDAWINLEPLSTTNFSWDDPYGEKLINVKVRSRGSVSTGNLDLEKDLFSTLEGSYGLKFHAVDVDDIKVARFTDENMNSGASSHDETMTLAGNWGSSKVPSKIQSNVTPLEIIIELGVFGVSLVDHRPKELSYLYLERVFMSYSTGYDGGTTSRFKLILGHLQLDNQLPLTLMPVLLAPEQNTDGQQPVFKITLTMRNENADGIQVYPYVYIRVTERCWRLNIHEPIIWALVNFYNNLQLDRIPQSSNVTQVDPEIRVDLIDVSEVRLKIALETAPAQRPHGVLGVWSPVLSAIGNAFKIQVHLRKVMHRDRFMRKSSVLPAIGNRFFRDLIHNPLHLIFSVDVLGMTSSTLASLSKGFAELSTDGQFVQLRTKQVRSRKITGVGDGIIQGTEALAQGVAFGVSGVVRKPVESARQNGLLGLAHGLGQAFLGFIVQPVSGALDFFSLTVDGIGASCTRCLDIFNNKTTFERMRNPRAFRASGVLTEYCEREALGQMVLYLAEASRHFGCTEIFKEPSKFAWSDFYEDHFVVPYHRIVLVTSRRVMLLQCMAPEKMDKRPCKIMWDVPWEELMALELAKAGSQRPSHLILHLKTFRRSEVFVRVIKCGAEEESDGREPQAVKICSVVRRMWKAYQADMKSLILKVPSSQRQVYFAWSIADGRDSRSQNKSIIRTRDFSSFSSSSDLTRFVKHSINFFKIWSSEQESRGRCTLCRKQVQSDVICSIWRPICPEGYVSIGDIAHVGSHPPNVAAVYRYSDKLFAPPVGYDLVWRNCSDDYASAVSIWLPRAPDGYISCGCVVVADFHEPEPDLVYCLVESLAEETVFEDQKIWSTLDSYPWGCHLYQVRSDALHFIALRQPKEESDWKPMRVMDDTDLQSQEQAAGSG